MLIYRLDLEFWGGVPGCVPGGVSGGDAGGDGGRQRRALAAAVLRREEGELKVYTNKLFWKSIKKVNQDYCVISIGVSHW